MPMVFLLGEGGTETREIGPDRSYHAGVAKAETRLSGSS
jgi:hypothetical protein